MIEFLNTIITAITALSGGNEMVAGALTLAASAFLSGAIAFVLLTLPSMVQRLFMAQLTTSFVILSSAEDGIRDRIPELMKFVGRSITQFGTRTLALEKIWDHENDRYLYIIVIGYGRHFIIYNKKIWCINKEIIDEGAVRITTRLTLTVLGRSHEPIKSLIADWQPIPRSDSISIFKWGLSENWDRVATIDYMSPDDIAIDPAIITPIINEISYFANAKDEYKRLGLTHKITYLFHGIPGIGKTSLIKLLASQSNLSIHRISLSTIGDAEFESVLNKLPPKSILVMEDVDAMGDYSKRVRSSKEGEDDYSLSVSLSGLLNALDGIVPLNGNIIIMTTNHKDKLDAALLRAGRIDRMIELPIIESEFVKTYFERLYPGIQNINCNFPALKGCEINDIVFRAKMDGRIAADLLNVVADQTGK